MSKYLPLLIACAGLFGYQTQAFAEDVKPSNNNIGNRVTVEDAEFAVNNKSVEYDGELGDVYGGGSESSASDVAYNSILINGGSIDAVLGGVSASGNVSDNVVEINGGNIRGVVGGLAVVNHELENAAGNVTGNRVIIHGGTIQFVSGGEIAYTYSGSGGSFDSALSQGNVSNNVVEIDGGKITGEIVGGAALKGNAIDNTVIIGGAPDLFDAYLYGGLTDGGISEGNTLRLRTTGLTARNISDFQNINFDLPDTTRNGDTVLTLTDGKTDLSGVHMNVYVDGAAPIATNDSISLLVNSNGINTRGALASSADVDETSNVKTLDDMTYDGVIQRGAVGYDLELVNNGDTFTANVGEQIYPPKMVPPPIPIILPDKGEFDHITLDDIEQVQGTASYEPFMNNGFGHLKTKTGNGSYIKNNSATHDFGIARHFKREHGVFTFAPTFTYSYGNYDAYLPSGARGSGNQQYGAGGVIIRNFNNSGFYYEGSVRAGRSHAKYVTDDFPLTGHPHMSYTTNAPILLGHLRVGNQWRLGKNNVLDVYGYYAYARQGSSDTELNVGNHVSFSSTDIGRLRTGYRLTSRLNAMSRLYTGLAFQYDNHSDGISRVEGIASNNLADDQHMTYGKDGSSGMLEIGWIFRPIKDNPWTIDMYATGWVGMQEGVTAMAKVKKAF